jgi:undecaprenyl diphosphate synthase
MSDLNHIAFIMDGNRRWARAKKLAPTLGHAAGYKSMVAVLSRCVELGIKYISFFAWSTENWKRESEEVDGVMKLARGISDADIEKLMKLKVRLSIMGDISAFSKDLQQKITGLMEKTKHNDGAVLNICINYGGRADIVQATNKILSDTKCGGDPHPPKASPKITEQSFEKYLYGADIPDVDMLVRTGGEQRISNFMLWKIAYAEIYFVKKMWPVVGKKFVDECVKEFQKRNRRLGK